MRRRQGTKRPKALFKGKSVRVKADINIVFFITTIVWAAFFGEKYPKPRLQKRLKIQNKSQFCQVTAVSAFTPKS